ncbi:hypothetical protein BS78_08G110200 [Paspalum vaginatum]|nr:hypothetical protein BS78_08G110200 [Paspalum vaginatum]
MATAGKRTILALFIWAMATLIFVAAPQVLADQIYCFCCPQKRACTSDPDCCRNGCCSN